MNDSAQLKTALMIESPRFLTIVSNPEAWTSGAVFLAVMIYILLKSEITIRYPARSKSDNEK